MGGVGDVLNGLVRWAAVDSGFLILLIFYFLRGWVGCGWVYT